MWFLPVIASAYPRYLRDLTERITTRLNFLTCCLQVEGIGRCVFCSVQQMGRSEEGTIQEGARDMDKSPEGEGEVRPSSTAARTEVTKGVLSGRG